MSQCELSPFAHFEFEKFPKLFAYHPVDSEPLGPYKDTLEGFSPNQKASAEKAAADKVKMFESDLSKIEDPKERMKCFRRSLLIFHNEFCSRRNSEPLQDLRQQALVSRKKEKVAQWTSESGVIHYEYYLLLMNLFHHYTRKRKDTRKGKELDDEWVFLNEKIIGKHYGDYYHGECSEVKVEDE